MLFSSYLFIFLFLPSSLLAYYLSPRKVKNVTLLVISYIFYSWGAPTLIIILFGSSIIDFMLAKLFFKQNNIIYKKYLFFLAIAINICLLAYFKYANFFITEVSEVFKLFGFNEIYWQKIALPIGISFFTFQKISYLADVYRNKVEPAKNLINYLLFVALFPQLIAGPIIRYHSINLQIENRLHSFDRFFSGFVRFAIGLGKKVILADSMGAVSDNIFHLEAGQLSTGYAWLGIITYSLQIYFDFSGYSSMAIGLGRMFGFEFQENFNYPYISKNLTEFWRRWHISLSNFMKEYLYIPLGGNQVSVARNYLNLWIVFILSGLWHGASWNFIFWGVFHGLILSLDKMFWLKFSSRFTSAFNLIFTYFIVLNSWVLFRSENFSIALSYFKKLYYYYQPNIYENRIYLDQIINNKGIIFLLIGLSMIFIPATKIYQKYCQKLFLHSKSILIIVLQGIFAILIYILTILSMATATYNPFIYFQF